MIKHFCDICGWYWTLLNHSSGMLLHRIPFDWYPLFSIVVNEGPYFEFYSLLHKLSRQHVSSSGARAKLNQIWTNMKIKQKWKFLLLSPLQARWWVFKECSCSSPPFKRLRLSRNSFSSSPPIHSREFPPSSWLRSRVAPPYSLQTLHLHPPIPPPLRSPVPSPPPA